MENPSRVHFSLPTAAGRSVGGENLVFSYEEIRNGLVKRVGPAMVLCPGVGGLHLGFDVPDDGPLVADPIFREFARKLVRSIPSPFFALSLQNDALIVLFLATIDNLEIRWKAGEDRFVVEAEAMEYAARFGEDEARLREVLSADGEMKLFEARCALVRMSMTGKISYPFSE